MALIYNGTNITSAYDIIYNGTNLQKIYYNNVLVWQKGNLVTYVCNGSVYQEYVQVGASVLKPTTFVPSLSNATFLGWSNSGTSTVVQTSLVMGDSPMTLYAVWKQNDSVLYDDGKKPYTGYEYDEDEGYTAVTICEHGAKDPNSDNANGIIYTLDGTRYQSIKLHVTATSECGTYQIACDAYTGLKTENSSGTVISKVYLRESHYTTDDEGNEDYGEDRDMICADGKCAEVTLSLTSGTTYLKLLLEGDSPSGSVSIYDATLIGKIFVK